MEFYAPDTIYDTQQVVNDAPEPVIQPKRDAATKDQGQCLINTLIVKL